MDNLSPYMVSLSNKRDVREVGDITDRLKKVLSNVELLFEEEEEEFFSERRQFENRYGDISAQMDAREKERAEMLKSLAEVLDEKSPSPEFLAESNGDDESSETDLSDHIESTKMGFQKLQELKEEMSKLSSKGKSTDHLKKQKTDLKLKVVEKFKMLYSTKKQRSQNKTIGEYWKLAAEEIVQMLNRVRTEGLKDKERTEQELIKIEKTVKRQAESMIRLEHQVSEKQKVIDSLNKTLEVAKNENEMLTSEVDRYRDKVVYLKKQLRLLSGNAEPAELVDSGAQTFLSMVSLINAVNDEVSAVSMFKEEALQSVADAVRESPEYQELLLRVEGLEKKVIEKETQIMKMEHRTPEPGLSDEQSGLPGPAYSGLGPITISDSDVASAPAVAKDTASLQRTKPDVPLPQEKPTSDLAPVDLLVNVNDDTKKHISQLTEEKDQLQVEMNKLREQFVEATRQIITLKYAVDVKPVEDRGSYWTKVLDQSVKGAAGRRRVSKTVRSADDTDGGSLDKKGIVTKMKDHVGAEPGSKDEALYTDQLSSITPMRPQQCPGSGPSQKYNIGARQPEGQQLSGPSEYGGPVDQPRRGSRKGSMYQSGRDSAPQLGDTSVYDARMGQRGVGLGHGSMYLSGRDSSQGSQFSRDSGSWRQMYTRGQQRDYQAEQRAGGRHLQPNQRKGPDGSILPPVPQSGGSKYFAFPATKFLPAAMQRDGVKPAEQGSGRKHSGMDEFSDSGTEFHSFIDELQSYSQYMGSVIEDEIARLSEANEELVKKLSEQSMKYFNQLYPNLLSGAVLRDDSTGAGRGSRFIERPSSPFTWSNAFAILQSGGRRINGRITTPTPLQQMMSEDAPFWEFPSNTPQLWQDRKKSASVEPTTSGGLSEALDTSDQGDVLASKKSVGTAKRGIRQPLPFKRQRVTHSSDEQRPPLGKQRDTMRSSDGDRRKGRAPSSVSLSGHRGPLDSLASQTASKRMTSVDQEKPDWESRKNEFKAGIEAINRLEGASLKVKQQMAKQFTKYFCLSEVRRAREFQSKMHSTGRTERSSVTRKTPDRLPSNMLLKRIQSLLCDMDEANQQQKDMYEKGKLPRITHTQSLSSLENIPSMYPKGPSRRWMKIPEAKYPGKGYVVVQTDRFPIYYGELLKKRSTDSKVGSHRPVPKTHQQLNATHRLLMEKQQREQRVKDQQLLRNVINLEKGMKFDPSLDETSADDSSDVHHIIKTAHDQLFNPETLRDKYLAIFESS